jgi:hypothetical protein
MDNQLNLFKEYKKKIKAVAGEKTSKEIISKNLYLVVTGMDDLADTYFTTTFRRNYDLSTYIQLVVQFASKISQVNHKQHTNLELLRNICVPDHQKMACHMKQNIRMSNV